MTITTLISLGVLVCYLVVFFGIFKKVPTSLSDTYYHFEGLREGWGIVFVLALMTMAMSIAPALFIASEGHPLQFLGFFTVAGLCFVGAAPKFREVGMESVIHPIAAFICATACILWIVLVARMWWVLLLSLVFISLLAILTKSWKCYTFWLEMIAFMSIFGALLMMR